MDLFQIKNMVMHACLAIYAFEVVSKPSEVGLFQQPKSASSPFMVCLYMELYCHLVDRDAKHLLQMYSTVEEHV